MTGEIVNLIRLQELFLEKQKKSRERNTLPAELEGADRAFREKVAAIENLKATLEDTEISRRAGEGRLAELSDKLKKYQTQLMGVKNSREYGAMLNEIDQVKRAQKEAEDEVVTLMEKAESARQELEERSAKLPEETEEHEITLSDWRETQKRIDRELAELAESTAELEKTFPPRRLAEIYRLFERKGGHAVVRAVGGSCSACHVRLRPALYQALRLSGEIITCDSCKRILFYQDDAAASS